MSTSHRIVRTKAGREEIAKKIGELATKIGATVERTDRSREIVLHVTRDPYSVMMIFDGREPISVFLAHWNVVTQSGATYPIGFPVGSVNEFHHRKATSSSATLEGLLLALEHGFDVLKGRQ
jgi:hypothetical protein